LVVAYAKRSGVQLLRPSLEGFIQRGGRIKAIVGIDQKNTSIEALQDLRTICTEIHVFHCEDFSQTFHTKLYFFDDGNAQAELIIGSNNFTNGGFQRNTELSIGKRLHHTNSDEGQIIQNIDSIINSYHQPCITKAPAISQYKTY
jgi:HKD family nuclease